MHDTDSTPPENTTSDDLPKIAIEGVHFDELDKLAQRRTKFIQDYIALQADQTSPKLIQAAKNSETIYKTQLTRSVVNPAGRNNPRTLMKNLSEQVGIDKQYIDQHILGQQPTTFRSA